MARYDYGLRGYRETGRRRPGRPGHLHPGGEDPLDRVPAAYDRDDRGRWGGGWYPGANRVTSRYNRDYVERGRERYPMNYNPYAGDTAWRMGDFTEYERPYLTKGGSRTYRGGREVGWERWDESGLGPVPRPRWPRRYGRDYRDG